VAAAPVVEAPTRLTLPPAFIVMFPPADACRLKDAAPGSGAALTAIVPVEEPALSFMLG
jgi:hypothetical protein